jgi:hypothetical protein
MTHEEALKKSQEYLSLIGKEFRLPDGETESVKTVVAWDEGQGNWQPHVCFYNCGEENEDNIINHMNLQAFFRTYQPV